MLNAIAGNRARLERMSLTVEIPVALSNISR
jgi:hypothetical protein